MCYINRKYMLSQSVIRKSGIEPLKIRIEMRINECRVETRGIISYRPSLYPSPSSGLVRLQHGGKDYTDTERQTSVRAVPTCGTLCD
jgi:hypothetical protein